MIAESNLQAVAQGVDFIEPGFQGNRVFDIDAVFLAHGFGVLLFSRGVKVGGILCKLMSAGQGVMRRDG